MRVIFGALVILCSAARVGDVLASPGHKELARELRDCDSCPTLVVVPRGRFEMGSENDGEAERPETPVHTVRIGRPFALGKFEVTRGEFRAFVAATGYTVAAGCRVQEQTQGPRGRLEWRDDPTANWQAPGLTLPVADDMPVTCVGRVDALAYVEWLSRTTGQRYRLPSESEWEYAARGGARGSYPWGSNPDLACKHGNLYDRTSHARLEFGWSYVDCEDGYVELAPVGRFQANGFGLYDMIGNAYEWTADCYRKTYDGAPTDGSPVTDERCALWSVRGGSWMTRPSRNRLTFRGRDPNDARYSYFGFRVARDVRP